jgi:hypothetical protein
MEKGKLNLRRIVRGKRGRKVLDGNLIETEYWHSQTLKILNDIYVMTNKNSLEDEKHEVFISKPNVM